jgi:elongation factor Ts
VAEINANDIKKLREETGAGVMDCKKALEASGGDFAEAVVWLREQGIAKAAKREGRETANGVVEAYVHQTGGGYPPQTGALIELDCESDFVAKGDDFRKLARELAMHVAAAAPRWISREEVPPGALEQEEAADEETFYRENVLLEQLYIRDPSTTIGDLIKQSIAKLQENITVRRFARFNVKEA